MSIPGAKGNTDIWKTIHRDSLPELIADPGLDWNAFYRSVIVLYPWLDKIN
ncbi:MAG: hypothetical protein LBU32_09390 [Clostridiales bacterium]|jgi:hypothetical protein|nr:hypothetical protein [Clostridiales bacterium]